MSAPHRGPAQFTPLQRHRRIHEAQISGTAPNHLIAHRRPTAHHSFLEPARKRAQGLLGWLANSMSSICSTRPRPGLAQLHNRDLRPKVLRCHVSGAGIQQLAEHFRPRQGDPVGLAEAGPIVRRRLPLYSQHRVVVLETPIDEVRVAEHLPETQP